MRHWAEGVVALILVALLGWSFGLYAGDSGSSGGTTTTTTTLATDPEAAARGALVADAQGCLLCHSTDGTDASAPTFKSLAGAERPLTTGEFVTADDAYLRRSIVDPAAQIVAGYELVAMPTNFEELLTDQQIDDLIEYIKSLGA